MPSPEYDFSVISSFAWHLRITLPNAWAMLRSLRRRGRSLSRRRRRRRRRIGHRNIEKAIELYLVDHIKAFIRHIKANNYHLQAFHSHIMHAYIYL